MKVSCLKRRILIIESIIFTCYERCAKCTKHEEHDIKKKQIVIVQCVRGVLANIEENNPNQNCNYQVH